MTSIGREIRRLARLAGPVVATQLAMQLLGVVDTLMVGHVDVRTLAAASLGHVWTFGTLIFGMGVVIGIDPLVAQAHGAGDARRQSLALQRGILVGLAASAPVALLWWWTDRAMALLGQDPQLAALARSYVVVQIPSIPFFLVFTALRQFLQGRGVVAPAMFVALVANLFNALANWVLIFGQLGLPALGIVGAGLSTGLTRVFLLLGLLLLVRRYDLARGGWTGWSREALRRRGLAEVLQLGVPIGAQFMLEVWAFQIATLLAGRLGEVQLAAHTIVLNVASLSFMVPLGISMAAVTRVGNLLGAGRPRAAQRAAHAALGMGATAMISFALLFVVLRRAIPAAFTGEVAVVALAATVLPVAAAFQVFDGLQVVGVGVLRGMGSTRPAAVINVLGFYCLALPLGHGLAFRGGMGLPGLWWGLASGLAAVAVMLVVRVVTRGPATVRRPTAA